MAEGAVPVFMGEVETAAAEDRQPSEPRPSSELRPSRGDFVSLSHLGEGSVGSVTKVMHKTSGNIYALKAIDKQKIRDNGLSEQLLSEVKTQLTLVHPNLLRCFDYFEDTSTVFLILEFAGGGDLYRYLRQAGALSEPDAAHIFAQIVDGVRFLHEHGIIHRDLKPETTFLPRWPTLGGVPILARQTAA